MGLLSKLVKGAAGKLAGDAAKTFIKSFEGYKSSLATQRSAMVAPSAQEDAQCSTCQRTMSASSHFCPHCGAKVEAPVSKFCMSCGEKMNADANFCPGCGHKNNS